MSTILKALGKRRAEQARGEDPEAILDRNAVYREEVRRQEFWAAKGPWIVVLASASAVLALLCGLVVFLFWPKPDADPDGVLAQRATPRAVDSRSAPVVVPPEDAGPGSPLPRESIRLRAQPLLRPSPTFPAPAPMVPTIERIAPLPPPAATPMVTPAPIVVFVTPLPAATPGPPLPAATPPPKTTPPPSNELTEILRLTGVVLDPKNPTALINDQIVRVGDVIEGARVLAIDSPTFVRVEYRGKQYDLGMD